MTSVVVVAAGDGTRLGLGLPKALVPVAGRTMLERCIETMVAAGVGRVVVAAPPTAVALVEALTRGQPNVRVVAGGASRQASVAAGLVEVDPDDPVVLVHDAARPLTPPTQVRRVVEAVSAGGIGIVPALPVADTVKSVDASGAVVATVDRSSLAAVQTPQGFPTRALLAAYASADVEHTDDAALFAAAGGVVHAVPGHPEAFKITTPADLERAESLVRRDPVLRTGVGLDVHGFAEHGVLHLGGLEWPDERALAGHSDGDVVCHAIADALLSAAALGDLGSRFGVARPEEAGRPGVDFVERAVALLAAAGATPVSVAVQVVGERPRVSGRRDAMQELLGAVIGAPVAVAGTTTDGLGFTGRGEGVAAIATALVRVG